ncbi:PA domain-containing protein [Priestia aryabhattai B8W22]|uniref:M28 family peptidase n=1 Tax=Priestia aryabhattai TaxID=412384 RepID=UPI00087FD230|nr:PA domain-containing protein [Priestia aryabhattai B8W22]
MRKTVISLAVATSLTLSFTSVQASTSANASHHQSSEQKVLKKINAEKIYQDIAYLSKKPRVAGTEAELEAATFVQKRLSKLGYESEVEPFTFTGYTPAASFSLSANGISYSPTTFTYSTNGNVTAEIVDGGLGTKDNLANKDVTGKIVLVQRGTITFGEKVLNAAEKGAAAVIIFNNTDGELNGTLGGANDNYIPSLAVTKEAGEKILTSIQKGEKPSGTVKIEGAVVSERTSYNVTATKPSTFKKKGTNDIIVVGAHHDSVAGAPGANDDASGTAMVLELARVFKTLPTDTELRFVTFGAEEVGLLGSEHYVGELSEDEKNRIVGMFNLDMVGSRDAGDLVMNTADGTPNLVTELAQASSTRLNGSPTPFQAGGRSDHVPFAEAGIPAALFIHSPSEPWYHTPEDTLDKISKEKLQDVAEIVRTAIYDRSRPDQQGPSVKKKATFKAPHLYYEQDVK